MQVQATSRCHISVFLFWIPFLYPSLPHNHGQLRKLLCIACVLHNHESCNLYVYFRVYIIIHFYHFFHIFSKKWNNYIQLSEKIISTVQYTIVGDKGRPWSGRLPWDFRRCCRTVKWWTSQQWWPRLWDPRDRHGQGGQGARTTKINWKRKNQNCSLCWANLGNHCLSPTVTNWLSPRVDLVWITIRSLPDHATVRSVESLLTVLNPNPNLFRVASRTGAQMNGHECCRKVPSQVNMFKDAIHNVFKTWHHHALPIVWCDQSWSHRGPEAFNTKKVRKMVMKIVGRKHRKMVKPDRDFWQFQVVLFLRDTETPKLAKHIQTLFFVIWTYLNYSERFKSAEWTVHAAPKVGAKPSQMGCSGPILTAIPRLVTSRQGSLHNTSEYWRVMVDVISRQ